MSRLEFPTENNNSDSTERGTSLVVDLDGSLIKSDLLVESAFALLAKSPWKLFLFPFWLFRGKSYLKFKIAEFVDIDPKTLPYNEQVLAYAMDHSDNIAVILASASTEKYVKSVNAHLGFFSGYIASDQDRNMTGLKKVEKLRSTFGIENFDYIGNSQDDIPIWRVSGEAIAVNDRPDARFWQSGTGKRWKYWLKALRPHQWAKNALVGVPMVAAHAINLTNVASVALAFIAFSSCASSVYLLNDLLDIQADRQHPTKKNRPFAAGTISIKSGSAVAILLLIFSAIISLFLPLMFRETLALYYIATNAYSLFLKRKMIIDVVTLAGLYAVRVLAGATAVGIVLSEWLLAFAMFIFLALALMKRHAEMALRLDSGLSSPNNRGYRLDDLTALLSLASASGFSAVIVLALYVANPATNILYTHPRWLLLECPLLLYWVARVVMITHRHELHDDPVVFALRDRTSLLTAALMLVVGVVAAWYK